MIGRNAVVPEVDTMSHDIGSARRIGSQMLRSIVAMLVAAGLTTGYAVATRAHVTHEIQVSSSLLRSLMPRKLFFGVQARTFAMFCSMKNSREVNLKYGCRNIGVFEYYANKKKTDTIDFADAFEFSPSVYSVIFAPSDFRFPSVSGRPETTNLQSGCDQIRLYDKHGIAFIVHVSEKVGNVDACLFRGLFAYLGFEIPGGARDMSLEEGQFIYDFIACPKSDYDHCLDYARVEASREDVVVKIVD